MTLTLITVKSCTHLDSNNDDDTNYSLSVSELLEVGEEKDLGSTVNIDLRAGKHC